MGAVLMKKLEILSKSVKKGKVADIASRSPSLGWCVLSENEISSYPPGFKPALESTGDGSDSKQPQNSSVWFEMPVTLPLSLIQLFKKP